MNKSINRNTIIVAIVCLLVGRYILTPQQKTKEVVKIVEVEKTRVDTKKKIITKEVKSKDGTTVKETVETENTVTDTEKDTKISSTTDKKTGNGLTLGILAIVNASQFESPEYGATISVPLIGNLNAQGIVTTDKRVGVGISLSL